MSREVTKSIDNGWSSSTAKLTGLSYHDVVEPEMKVTSGIVDTLHLEENHAYLHGLYQRSDDIQWIPEQYVYAGTWVHSGSGYYKTGTVYNTKKQYKDWSLTVNVTGPTLKTIQVDPTKTNYFTTDGTVLYIGTAYKWESTNLYTMEITWSGLTRALKCTQINSSNMTYMDGGLRVFVDADLTTLHVEPENSSNIPASGSFFVITATTAYLILINTSVRGVYNTNRLALSSYTYNYPEGTTDYTFGEGTDTSVANNFNIDVSSSNWSR